MPLQDTLDTFTYLISEADKLGLSYITLVRLSPVLGVEIEGKLVSPTSSFMHLIHNTYRQKARHTTCRARLLRPPHQECEKILIAHQEVTSSLHLAKLTGSFSGLMDCTPRSGDENYAYT